MKSVSFLLVLLLAVSGAVFAHGNEKHESGVLSPHSEVTAKGQCVEEEDVMRRRHMEFILHQRDKTQRHGIRTSKYSLKNCINCHADPETKSVLGKKGFCQECHSYAAVTIDCFSCHSSKAQPGVKPIPALPTSAASTGENK
jgi:hypothetical protein